MANKRKGMVAISMSKTVLFTIILAVLLSVTGIAAMYLNKLTEPFSRFEIEPEVIDSMHGLACAINSVAAGKVDSSTCQNWDEKDKKLFQTPSLVIKNFITGFVVGEKQYSVIKKGDETTVNYRTVQVKCYPHGSSPSEQTQTQITQNKEEKEQQEQKQQAQGNTEEQGTQGEEGGLFDVNLPPLGAVTGRVTEASENNGENKGEEEGFGKLDCDVIHFSLPQKLSDSDFINWIRGYGAPKYVLYYEGFPQGEQAAWLFPANQRPVYVAVIISGINNMVLNFMFGRIFKGGNDLVEGMFSGAKRMFKSPVLKIASLLSREGEETGEEILKRAIIESGGGLDKIGEGAVEQIANNIKSGESLESALKNIKLSDDVRIKLLQNKEVIEEARLLEGVGSKEEGARLLQEDLAVREALSTGKYGINDFLKNIVRKLNFLSYLNDNEKRELIKKAVSVVNNYLRHGKAYKLYALDKLLNSKTPQQIIQEYAKNKDEQQLLEDLRKISLEEGLECGVITSGKLTKGISAGTCFVLTAMELANLKDDIDSSLYRPSGINTLGLYTPKWTLYNIIYGGKKQEIMRLNNAVRGKYVILDKGHSKAEINAVVAKAQIQNADIKGNGKADSDDTTFYLVSPCKATLKVSPASQGEGVSTDIGVCVPWRDNLEYLLEHKYELGSSSLPSEEGPGYGGESELPTPDTTILSEGYGPYINTFCTEDYIKEHFLTKEMQDKARAFCSCIPDDNNIIAGVNKEIKYNKKECKKWLMNPSLIMDKKEIEESLRPKLSSIVIWIKKVLFGIEENKNDQNTGNLIMLSKKDIINIENKLLTDCYEYYGGEDLAANIVETKDGGFIEGIYIGDKLIKIDDFQDEFNRYRGKDVYFCFNDLRGLGKPMDNNDRLFKAMCGAKGIKLDECKIYVVDDDVFNEIKKKINDASNNLVGGKCYPGGKVYERAKEMKKKNLDLKPIFFLYLSQPVAQVGGEIIPLSESLPENEMYANGYSLPILDNGDKRVEDIKNKKYWNNKDNGIKKKIINFLTGSNKWRITLPQKTILISVVKKEKTNRDNYCYMPAESPFEKYVIYGPGFLLDALGAVLEVSGIEPGAALLYFISGVYTAYEQHESMKEKAWPNSWGM